MLEKKCDLCNKVTYKTYNINLIDGDNDIDLKGKIDLCDNCADKIKESIASINKEE